jgi:hypothetical protein
MFRLFAIVRICLLKLVGYGWHGRRKMRSHLPVFCIGGWDITIYAVVPFMLFVSSSSWYALGAGGSALLWKRYVHLETSMFLVVRLSDFWYGSGDALWLSS